MKRIFIIFTFIFSSLFSFAYNVNMGVRIPLAEQKVELDFNVKLLLGMIKAENNPKYEKLLEENPILQEFRRAFELNLKG